MTGRHQAGFLLVSLSLGIVAGCGGGGSNETSLEGEPWVTASGIDLPAAAVHPSAIFEQGTVSGSTGCNRFTGGYTADGDSLTIDRVASTRMACPPPADAIESAYLAALDRVTGWHLDGNELVLVDEDGEELLRYAAATPVGNWQATGLLLRADAFSSLLGGTEVTARFGADGKLTGSAGCNTYGASYTIDKGQIEITDPASTKKACSEPAGVMEQETAYLSLLTKAASYRVDGGSLELVGADGTRLVSYGRAKQP